MSQIDVPGYGLTEFPDEMTDEQIVAAIKAMPPPPVDKDINLDPTAGMSGLEKFNAGAGKAVSDAGLALQQMFSDVARYSGDEFGATSVNDPTIGKGIQAKVDQSRKLDA